MTPILQIAQAQQIIRVIGYDTRIMQPRECNEKADSRRNSLLNALWNAVNNALLYTCNAEDTEGNTFHKHTGQGILP